ncbi:ABC transporter permease [Angustibacter sp. McL0619]|uniref:ABC transporter permease n=1 Tax=Angustibacter sp. McL0619 TaxID=3415676 RepID=UPI003CF8C2C3
MTWLSDTWNWLTDPSNWSGPDGAGGLLWQHIWLSAVALIVAFVLVAPLGVWLGHERRGAGVALNVGNIGRAVPTFALLVLLTMAPRPLGPSSLSVIVALVLFAIPPILTNSYVGVREVDPAAVDAARGMGMSGWQVLRGVELPLAAPLIVQGARLAAVQIIATATIAGIVGGGGLGQLITAGFSLQDQPQLLSGAVLVAVLALVVEGIFEVVQRLARPVPVEAERVRRHRGGSRSPAAVGASD